MNTTSPQPTPAALPARNAAPPSPLTMLRRIVAHFFGDVEDEQPFEMRLIGRQLDREQRELETCAAEADVLDAGLNEVARELAHAQRAESPGGARLTPGELRRVQTHLRHLRHPAHVHAQHLNALKS